MALSRPTCISTWASAATSPIQEGVEGTDSGFTWMVTDVCVILGVCPPLREIEIFTSFLIRRHISSVFSTLLLTAQLNNLVAHLVGIRYPKLVSLLEQVKNLYIPGSRFLLIPINVKQHICVKYKDAFS